MDSVPPPRPLVNPPPDIDMKRLEMLERMFRRVETRVHTLENKLRLVGDRTKALNWNTNARIANSQAVVDGIAQKQDIYHIKFTPLHSLTDQEIEGFPLDMYSLVAMQEYQVIKILVLLEQPVPENPASGKTRLGILMGLGNIWKLKCLVQRRLQQLQESSPEEPLPEEPSQEESSPQE
ncbi:hypothetical protein FHL15_008051 [Xylaria flabelliformis]|uniref:Uncharacterized protein n=1 Tax=Xylaria flabelliformis TaxID=2512241 RepID=A0A553HSZ1_9PEZI|nr:hypothetical protein FHL15_008051 [Xylaria flabelliformis]